MSCSVAVCNSPVFSPSSSLFCSKTSPAQEALNLTLTHLKASPSPSSPSPSSPTSSFWFRLQKPPTVFSSSAGYAVESLALGSATNSDHAPAAALKRKRPTRLHIPVAPGGFAFVPPVAMTPREERSELERDGDGYSVYCKRGRRESMEDRYSAAVNLRGDPKQAFFGIFDGHGGVKAAEFAAQNLDRNIIEELARRDGEDIEDAVKHGYLTTDAEFLKDDVRGGTCCVTALIRNGKLVVSNAGDCRAVMSNRGVAEALTSDHRPSRPDERDRIEKLGGYVDVFHGVWRIQGSLAVSRGIGDRHLKQWVVAEPETKSFKLRPHHEFLILASDGLWDKVSNQEAVDIARPTCMGSDKAADQLSACKRLAALAVSRGSCDDVSVMLIPLGAYM